MSIDNTWVKSIAFIVNMNMESNVKYGVKRHV